MATTQTSDLRGIADRVRDLARRNNAFFGAALPMIASENILSPRALEMLATDFHGRYAEGLPGKRYYQGCQFFDEVEQTAIDLAQRLFRAHWANVQVVSGTVANMAVFKALAKPGDAITGVSTADGGHISHASMGSVGLRGLEPHTYPWDEEAMTIDVDGAVRLVREVKPSIALFGQSMFLFPTPLREVSDAAHEVGASVMYDGAHVLGLVGGGAFQDPLREGADVMTGSTHKTLPGPQGGVIVSDHARETPEDQKWLRRLDGGVFPGVVSSYHLHHVAAKAVAFAEHLQFGAAYARDIIRNAKALGQALHERGFPVLGEARGFTASHQVVFRVGELGEGKGKWGAAELEKAGIVTNMNMIPGDTKAMSPSGIRLGVQELTRVGMGPGEMKEVAAFFERVLRKGEPAARVRADVEAFRRPFDEVRYCWNEKGLGGYEFHEIA